MKTHRGPRLTPRFILRLLALFAGCLWAAPAFAAGPSTPTGVSGTTSSATPAVISWGTVSGATSYTVYRGATSGAETSLATGVAGTSYSDTTAARGTTYYYTITAVNAGGESAQSSEVIVDPVNTASPYYQINAGGPAVSPFAADAYFSGGNGGFTSNTDDVTAINAAPVTVYKTERNSASGGPITYTLPGLTPGGSYVVRLQMAENYWSAAGQRKFNVAINGTSVLTQFDVWVAANAPHKAVVRSFNATADASGNIAVNFSNGSADQLEINALEILGGSVTAAPASLAAAQASATSASLTWGTVSGATTYNLYRGTAAGAEGSTPYQTGLTSAAYTDSGLTAGATYYYKVVAVNAQGESALSNEAAFAAVPSAPTGVSGTTSSATPAVISWGTVSGATSYTVYRGATSGAETSLATGVAGTSYSDTTAARGTTYYYTVAAVNAGGTSSQSAEVAVDPVNTASPYYQINAGRVTYIAAIAPFAADAYYSNPGGSVSTSGNTINVTAANAAPQAVYQVDRDGAGSGMTYTLPGLTAGGSYVVRLHMAEKYYGSSGHRLFNVSINGTTVLTGFEIYAAAWGSNKAVVRNFNATADGSGNITVLFSTNPNAPVIDGLEVLGGSVTAAPVSLAATEASPTSASLTWGTVSGATTYDLYRSTSAGTEGSTPYRTGLASASYTDTGLTAGTAYYYKVVAVNAQGESALSNEASLTIPTAPTGVTATPGNAQVALAWTATAGATSYVVSRATTPGGPYTQVGTPTGTSYTDSTAANNTYFYVVQAVNGAAVSANSAEVAATPGGASGLLGWWKMDEDAGTTANDSSGFANTGAFAGAGWATGRSGYAGSFNGTSGVVDMGKGVVATANSFSVACWVRMNSTSNYQIFISESGVNVSILSLYYNQPVGKFTLALASADSNALVGGAATSATTPVAGTWYHLLGIYDAVNGQLKLYVNGTLEATQAFSAPVSAGGHTLVGRGLYSAAPFAWVNGRIDDARVYNRVLTAAEIATISAYPTGAAAASGNANATVTWSAFPSAASYNLYRATTPGTEGGTPYQTGLASASYTDTGLTNGTTYYYKVAAVTASGESAHSDEVSTMPNAPPAAPTALAAVPGNTRATLSWTAATGGGTITYTVLRSTTSGSGYTAVTGGTGLSGTSFTDPTGGAALSNGTVYYYIVTATNNGGTSANSNQASVTPAMPALLLTKRITAINGVPLTGFVSDGTGNDANAYWPAPSAAYLRGATATTARPGDTVEYTIYFLAVGSGSVTSVVVSNVLPAHVTFAPTSYSGLTPTDGGTGPSGLALAASPSAYPSAPTVYLSNAADADRGTFYVPGVAVSGICTAAQNVSGVVVVNVVVSPTALPAATSAGSPYNSYGFVRYQVTIN